LVKCVKNYWLTVTFLLAYLVAWCYTIDAMESVTIALLPHRHTPVVMGDPTSRPLADSGRIGVAWVNERELQW